MQDDLVYAKDFVAAKWRNACWSPKKLELALRQKGVDSSDCEKAIAWLLEVCSSPSSPQIHQTFLVTCATDLWACVVPAKDVCLRFTRTQQVFIGVSRLLSPIPTVHLPDGYCMKARESTVTALVIELLGFFVCGNTPENVLDFFAFFHQQLLTQAVQ